MTNSKVNELISVVDELKRAQTKLNKMNKLPLTVFAGVLEPDFLFELDLEERQILKDFFEAKIKKLEKRIENI